MIESLMTQGQWLFAFAPAAVLGAVLLALFVRRAEMRRSAEIHAERAKARQRGSDKAHLLHPSIDLAHCIGCGSCVRACPEDGVLELLHGQAVVVHGARCVGHGLCAAACPAGAIALTFGDLSNRRDLPATSEDLQAEGVPGLFLAGEISGFSLVRTAVAHGVSVADAVAHRVGINARSGLTVNGHAPSNAPLDLLIVGAGPGGLAASLRAKERGLSFCTIEQESKIGGTVAAYPRRKLVMTQALDLPLYGRLNSLTYEKEDLVEVWEKAASSNNLPIRLGVRLTDVRRDQDGCFTALTSAGEIRAKNICLALGRRGSPRKLGVPGEDLPKVAYSLIDAGSYQGRKILVVGGGDSAVEAAMGLAEQPGNEVTVSYRKADFFRLKARNEARVRRAIHDGRLRVVFSSEVLEITPSDVTLKTEGNTERLANDEVFVFAGGDPPFSLMERAGVSFDASKRKASAPGIDRASNIVSVLSVAFFFAVVLAAWAYWFRGYYQSGAHERPDMDLHPVLRPSGPVGLAAGLFGSLLFVWNLTYLVRRSLKIGHILPGSLRTWMGSHVFSGLLGVLCILVHSGFSVRPTPGGHAFLALAVVIVTGAIGRYLYAFVPRAANGTEASLDDLRTHLANISAEWDRNGRGYGEQVRQQVDRLIVETRWRPGFLHRIGALLAGQAALRRTLAHARHEGRAQGIPENEIRRVVSMARRAYRLTLLVTHFEEIRAALSSWRYFHRWLGVLMVLLTVMHIVVAARYANLDFSWLWHLGRGAR